jgi:hypothetical protein
LADEKPLSIEDILAVDDIQYTEVEAWGGKVRLGSLTAGDVLEFVESNEGPAKRTAGIRLLIKSLVDADGNRIGRPEMLDRFRKKNAQIINMLVEKILILNGLSTKGTTEAAKNDSGEALPGASLTPSPSSSVM